MRFDWDEDKNTINQSKHGVSFKQAEDAFFDKYHCILEDKKHSSENEKRYFCLGKVHDEILTVRFTIRDNSIRIIGAGYWRKGRKAYEQENNLYR